MVPPNRTQPSVSRFVPVPAQDHFPYLVAQCTVISASQVLSSECGLLELCRTLVETHMNFCICAITYIFLESLGTVKYCYKYICNDLIV